MEENSMVLTFDVNSQTLTRTSSNTIVENSQNYLYAQFTFSNDWANTTKYAIFENEFVDLKYKVALNENDTCKIPANIIKHKMFSVTLVGENEQKYVVITTTTIRIPVFKTNYEGADEPEIKYFTSNTLDVVKDGDSVNAEIPNIYYVDVDVNNDFFLRFFGRNAQLLKTLNVPYGKVNDITLEIDNTDYVITVKGYDNEGTLLFTRNADLDIEGMLIESASYDSQNQELVLVFKNGTEVRIPISDILTGIATQDWVNTNFYTKAQSDNLLAQKQDTLINQQNIKSINGISVLGSGNIDTKNVGYVELDLSDLVDDTLNLTDAQIAEMQKEYAIIKVENEYYKKEFDATNDDNKLIFLYEFYFTTLLNSGIRESHVKYIVVDLTEKTATLMDEEAFSVYEKGKTDELLNTKQNVINANNKIDADFVDDSNSTHKFVSASEKAQITTNQTDITNIKDGANIDSFGDVETALGTKQETLIDSTSIEIVSNSPSVKQSYIDSQFATTSEINELIEEVFGSEYTI